MSERHTPTTDRIRDLFSFAVAWDAEPTEPHIIAMQDKARKEFDRWLAERDAHIRAAAEQCGAVKALRDAAKHMDTLPDRLGDHWLKPHAVSEFLKYRARLEGNGD